MNLWLGSVSFPVKGCSHHCYSSNSSFGTHGDWNKWNNCSKPWSISIWHPVYLGDTYRRHDLRRTKRIFPSCPIIIENLFWGFLLYLKTLLRKDTCHDYLSMHFILWFSITPRHVDLPALADGESQETVFFQMFLSLVEMFGFPGNKLCCCNNSQYLQMWEACKEAIWTNIENLLDFVHVYNVSTQKWLPFSTPWIQALVQVQLICNARIKILCFLILSILGLINRDLKPFKLGFYINK